jgi:hypothetical protein
LHDLTLIKMTVARFVGTGCFLIILTTIRNKHITNKRRSAIYFIVSPRSLAVTAVAGLLCDIAATLGAATKEGFVVLVFIIHQSMK